MLRLALLVLLTASCLAGCADDDVPRVNTEGIDPALVELFDRLVEEARADPASAQARGRLGMAYQANILLEPAELCYAQARERDPDEPRWWYYAAIAKAEVGEMAAAAALLDSTLVRDPGYALAWIRAGEFELANGKLSEAERAFRRATELRPNHPGGWLGLARIHLQRGEAESAEQILLAAVERRPHGLFVPYLHQLLGTVYRQTGRLEEAQAQLSQGTGGKPDWLDPWGDELDEFRVALHSRLEEVRLALEMDQGAEVLPTLEEMAEQNPANARVLTYLGIACAQAGRPWKAREALEAAAASDPEYGLAWENLADARARMGDGRGALEAIERALELNPRRASAHWRRGSYLAQAARSAEALEAFDQALAFDPSHVGALKASAGILLASGQGAEAGARLERVIATDPGDADAHAAAARAWILAGDTERAASFIDGVEALDPDHPALAALRRSVP